jgi:hypothetical protein
MQAKDVPIIVVAVARDTLAPEQRNRECTILTLPATRIVAWEVTNEFYSSNVIGTDFQPMSFPLLIGEIWELIVPMPMLVLAPTAETTLSVDGIGRCAE